MQVISDLSEAASIADPELRHLIEKTIRDLSHDVPYDPDELGYFLIVQLGDSLDAINEQIGFDIMVNRWSGIRFGDTGFAPSFELVDEFPGWFEMVFIQSDDGFGIEAFIAKSIDIPELLAMCQRYAVRGAL
jgi:hypothetical protein